MRPVYHKLFNIFDEAGIVAVKKPFVTSVTKIPGMTECTRILLRIRPDRGHPTQEDLSPDVQAQYQSLFESTANRFVNTCLNESHPGFLKLRSECTDPECTVREVLEL